MKINSTLAGNLNQPDSEIQRIFTVPEEKQTAGLLSPRAMSAGITPVRTTLGSIAVFPFDQKNLQDEQSIRELVGKVESKFERSVIYCNLAKEAELDSSKFKAVFKVVEKDQWQRAQLFRALALPVACEKNCELIKMTVTEFERSQLVSGIVEKAGNIEELENAEDLLDDFTNVIFKCELLSLLARKALNISEIPKSIQVVNKIPRQREQGRIFSEIGAKLLSMGQLQQLVDLTDQIRDPFIKTELLSASVGAYLQSGTLEKAVELVQKMPTGFVREKDLSLISEKLTEVEKAVLESILQKITDKSFQDELFKCILQVKVKRKQEESFPQSSSKRKYKPM